MRRTRGRTQQERAEKATTMSLGELEQVLSGASARNPGTAVIVTETARILEVVSSGAMYATITGERCPEGVRIVDGRESLDVARVLRARASWRGDHFWALELARRVRFRVVIREAGDSRARRSGRMVAA